MMVGETGLPVVRTVDLRREMAGFERFWKRDAMEEWEKRGRWMEEGFREVLFRGGGEDLRLEDGWVILSFGFAGVESRPSVSWTTYVVAILERMSPIIVFDDGFKTDRRLRYEDEMGFYSVICFLFFTLLCSVTPSKP
ncbi:hypothetical protein ACLOJK_021126 [Asimina triloba]